MATCPDGHQSVSEDYCDVCGMLIAGAPAARAPAGSGSAGGFLPASSPPASGAGASGAGASGGEVCPQCNAPRSGVFCESCGYNFAAAQGGTSAPPSAPPPSSAPAPSALPPVQPSPAPSSMPLMTSSAASVPPDTSPVTLPDAGQVTPDVAATPSVTAVPAGWTVVVAADRAYYDSVEAASGPDGSGIDFPAYCPERRFQLTAAEMRIGRRSPSRGLEPEIDLTGPPTDPGISRLHAVLIATPDGWVVIDPGSANGTQLNGTDIPTGLQLPVHDGDRINLGAWTMITVHHSG